MKHILIVISSVRPIRIGEQVASWVQNIASRVGGLTFELVDLKDWHLPMDDEPEKPADGIYLHAHTKAWSDKIKTGDGFIFVTPQYNWGYPASLKNALDHLYREWKGKPAAIVTYGHRGGVRAAGQLHEVLLGLHMAPTPTRPALIFNNEMLDEMKRLIDPAVAFAQYEPAVVQATQELLAEPAKAH
jgi:NAD(P)H-dependent FMN reductase